MENLLCVDGPLEGQYINCSGGKVLIPRVVSEFGYTSYGSEFVMPRVDFDSVEYTREEIARQLPVNRYLQWREFLSVLVCDKSSVDPNDLICRYGPQSVVVQVHSSYLFHSYEVRDFFAHHPSEQRNWMLFNDLLNSKGFVLTKDDEKKLAMGFMVRLNRRMPEVRETQRFLFA